MAERMAQKSLLARKGEARPAESEASDESLLDTPGEDEGASEGGFFFLRAKEPALDPGRAVGAEARLPYDSSEDQGAHDEAADLIAPAPTEADLRGAQTDFEGPQTDLETLESYSPPGESGGPFDKAVAGSLLDFRLIRGRERRVCPVSSDTAPRLDEGPKVKIPSLGTSAEPVLDVPRRAAAKPVQTPSLQSPASLPQPLPLSRQGDEAAGETPRPARLEDPSPNAPALSEAAPKAEIPIPQMPSTMASPASEGPSAEPEVGQAAWREADAAAPSEAAVETTPLQAALGRLRAQLWQGVRALPAVLGGTPHLAYLAGLLLLCALGGIWFILAAERPEIGQSPQIAEVQSPTAASPEPADQLEGTAAPQSEASAEAAAPAPSGDSAPSDDLALGGLKAAPVLASEDAMAMSPAPEEPTVLETQAGPLTAAGASSSSEGESVAAESDATATSGAAGTGLAQETANGETVAVNDSAAASQTEESEAAAASQQTSAVADDGAYTVQLFAARDRASAERALGAMTEKLAGALDGRGLHISEATSSSGRVMYRIRSAGFAEADDANKLCGALKKAGQDCLVLRRQ